MDRQSLFAMDSSNLQKFCARALKIITWKHFNQIDNIHAKCFVCKCLVSYKSSTSNLRKHMDRKHPTVRIRPFTQSESSRQRSQTVDGDDLPILGSHFQRQLRGYGRK
ncbi:unnamed protein product, partial [Nesidiocoris tenuis]